MENRPAIQALGVLQRRRLDALRSSSGLDSPEEDGILDAMDVAWSILSLDELEHLKTPGPYHEETVGLLRREAP